MQRRSALLIISLVTIGGWWLLHRPPTHGPKSSASSDATRVLSVKTPETKLMVLLADKKAKNVRIQDQVQTCLGVALKLTPGERIEEFLARPENDETWHWDNYFIDSPEGTALTVHVVPTETGSGREALSLKTFREDDDGPTLLEEKQFLQRSELEKVLAQKLRQGTLKTRQTVDTLHLNGDLEVKRTRDDGHVTELLWRSSRGKLDCKVLDDLLSCECN